MFGSWKCAVAAGVVSAFAVMGCAAPEGSSSDEAPEVSLDAVAAADEGTSYNGWSQSLYVSYETGFGWASAEQTLTRSYGDTARAGGVCLTFKMQQSCTADSTCTTLAKASYGNDALGYCYANTCYSRPGTQAAYCAVNPNRSDANGNMVLQSTVTQYGGGWAGIGCMSKAAGPNTACGGTDATQYMRTALDASTWYICDIPGEC